MQATCVNLCCPRAGGDSWFGPQPSLQSEFVSLPDYQMHIAHAPIQVWKDDGVMPLEVAAQGPKTPEDKACATEKGC
jgi:hypothetical protein